PITTASLAFGAIRAVLGIAPFSGFVGFITPMLVDQCSGGIPDRAGRAYAMNILGSIIGPVVAGFLVLPLAGERWGLSILSLPLFVIGFVGMLRESRRSSRFNIKPRVLFGAAVFCSLCLVVAT